MAWIELHDTLRDHRKTWALAAALNIPNAYCVGLLACLWTWALSHAVDGDLSRFPDEAVARAAGWEKKASIFVTAMIESEFINTDRRIHDWEQYAGRIIEREEIRRDGDKKRQQVRRDKLRTSQACHADVTCDEAVMSHDKHEHFTAPSHVNPLSTVPNRTLGYLDNNKNACACEGSDEDPVSAPPLSPEDRDIHEAILACGKAGIMVMPGQNEADIAHLIAKHTYAWVHEAILRTGDMPPEKRHIGYLKGILAEWKKQGRIDEPGSRARASPSLQSAHKDYSGQFFEGG